MQNGKVQSSVRWSFISEISVKFIVPITNMLLARILTPEAFGVIAVCNMLVSFVDIITEAGFGKYIVQKDFNSRKQEIQYVNVSFWTNLMVSLFLTSMIILFRYQLAEFLGNLSYARVLAVASLQLLITSFSSIQIALFRREFAYKKLFYARICVSLFPLVVTVPLALLLKSYWALVIGNLAGAFINSLILTLLSKWRPRLYYSFEVLKEMFSYSFWSLCEALANWMIFWIDTFIVGNFFNDYYLGLYKNATNMVQSVMGMIAAAISPVLLSTLSRLKHSRKQFEKAYFNLLNLVLYLAVPMGVGLFLYRETATLILFGEQWTEAANIVGSWALMMLTSIIFYTFPAEIYKSMGIPKWLFFFQSIYLVCLIPLCYIAARRGFWSMVYTRCLAVIIQAIVSMLFLRKIFHFHTVNYFVAMIRPGLATLAMIAVSLLLKPMLSGLLGDLLAIACCALVYSCILLVFDKHHIQDVWQGIRLTKV